MPSEELAEIAQWRRRLRVEDAAEFAHYGGPPRAPNLSIFFGDDRSNYSTASSEHSAAAATALEHEEPLLKLFAQGRVTLVAAGALEEVRREGVARRVAAERDF